MILPEENGLIPVHVELWYDDQWSDITPDVDASRGITIRRGRDDLQSSPSPASCSFTLDNRDGRYSARNPLSPLYGRIGQNTPVRVRVGDPEVSARFTGLGGTDQPLYVITPASSRFDTPVLDIRIDMEPDEWRPERWRVIATRTVWNTGDYQWELAQDTRGRLYIRWSHDGDYASLLYSYIDTAQLGISGRCAVRVVVDTQSTVDTTVVDWYLGESVQGPWQHVSQREVANVGNLPVYQGSAPLALGSSAVGNSGWNNVDLYQGQIHAFQLRDGEGDVLAELNPRSIELGPLWTRSFTDSAGNNWEVHGTTQLFDSAGAIRFTGFVTSWPSRWSNPEDSRTEIEAVGYRHLVDRASTPLRSPMFRACTNPGETNRLLGYWPMEEKSEATSFASGIGGPPMLVGRIPGYHVRDIRFAAYNGFRASEPLPEFNDTAAVATLPPSEPTGEIQVFMLAHGSPDGIETDKQIFSVTTTGSVTEWAVIWKASDDTIYVRGRDSSGSVVYESPHTPLGVRGHNTLLGLWLTQDGSDVLCRVFRTLETDETSWYAPNRVPGVSLGAPVTVTLAPRSGLRGTALGHVTVLTRGTGYLLPEDLIFRAFQGHYRESASDRIRRLGREEQIPVFVYGGGSEELDIQSTDSISRLLDSSAESDMGILVDSRDSATLTYIPRERLYNRPALEVDYEAHPVVAPMEPTDDDSELTNDVTVQRGRGSFYRAVLESGPLAADPPPEGVGRYETSYSLSLADDAQTERQAHWRLHLGTVDEYRYPRIALDLHNDLRLADRIRGVDVADRLRIINLPPWLPPGTADVLVQGYTEYLDGVRWTWTANCSPASPWSVGVADDAVYGRADTAGSVLVGDVDSETTDLPVLTTEGPLWVEEIEHFPFDVSVGGEIVTVVGVRPLLSDDFNRGDVGEWDYSVWDAGYWNSMVWGE